MKKTSYATSFLATLALCLPFSAVSAATTWTGASDNNYSNGDNWSTLAVPASTEAIEASAGTIELGANWERAAQSDFSGSTNFTLNGRLLNARADNSVSTINWDSTGTLTQSGNYFIVATNGGSTGKITQSAGVVSSSIDRGFFLSDTSSASGTYELTGGELNVTYTGYSSDFHSELLGRGGDDVLYINGGDATFTSTNSTDRRLYLMRNSQLTIDSGSANFVDFKYYVIGRVASNGTLTDSTPTVTLNGGELNVDLLTTGTVGFIVGGNGVSGTLDINGGDFTLTGGSMWLGDGGAVGVVDQSAGNVIIDGDVVIGRSAEETFDQYVMSGGTLSASNLLQGQDTTSLFNFSGGVITLQGDDRGVINESWFVASPGAMATYDALSDLTTITVVPEPSTLALAVLGLVGLCARYRR